MPVSHSSRKLNVALLAIPEVSAAVLYSLHEVFMSVGTVWEVITGEQTECRKMTPRIVASSTDTFLTAMGVPITADSTFDDDIQLDIIIVPDLFVDLNDDFSGRWPDVSKWLQKQYQGGALLCSVCTGTLVLAEAGILDGREATTHWAACNAFARHYQSVRLQPQKVLVPSGMNHDIVTSGGSASWSDLSLYLISRFCGEDEARKIAKIFLFGDRSQGQLPFSAMVRPPQHEDAAISDCQSWIAEHYDIANPVSAMARRSGLNDRTFKRRFRASTGYTPIDYVQSLRVEEAKHILESTNDPVEDVSAEVGYEDSSSFRRLFKRTVGISPNKYRQRFQVSFANQARLKAG